MSKRDKALWWLAEKYIQYKEKITGFVREFPELVAIPALIFIFVQSKYILRKIDPTAGAWDIGSIQTILPASIIVLGINFMVFLGFKFTFPTIYKDYVDLQTNELTQWQKLLSILLVVFLLSLEFLVVILALT